MHVPRQFFVTLKDVFRNPELTLFVVERGVIARSFPDQEGWIVIKKKLVKMVGTHHDQDIRPGLCQSFSICLNLPLPFSCLGDLLLNRRGSRRIIKRMMGCR